MTGYTNPDNLPYPDDYQQPADSPSAFQALAQSVQTALTAAKAYTIGRITQNWGSNTDVAISQAVVSAWKTAIEGRSILAGTGLSGGGTLAATRTLSVDSNVVALKSYVDSGLAGKSSTSHTHAAPDLRYKATVHGPFTVAAGTDTEHFLPHGLGTTPLAVLTNGLDDDGLLSIQTSVESWDGTNVRVNVFNFGAAAETYRVAVVAFK